MNDSERNPEDSLQKALQERFAGFESEVPPSLAERIFKALPASRSLVDWSISALLLLLIGIFLAIRTNHLANKSAGLLSRESRLAQPTLPFQRAGKVVAPASPNKARGLTPATEHLPSDGKQAEDRSAFSQPTSVQARQSVLKRNDRGLKVSAIRSNTGYWAYSIERPYSPQEIYPREPNNANGERALDAVAPNAAVAPRLMAPLAVRFLTVSALTFTSSSFSALPANSAVIRRKPTWLLYVTPMQTFQLLTLRSTPEWTISDVRFGSSWYAKGVKVSAGLEKNNTQFLVNYTFVPTVLSYRRALDEFTLPTVTSDPLEVTQSTTPLTLNDNLHLLSVGVRRKMAIRVHRTRYNGSVGLEYGWALPTGQSLGLANVGLSRELKLLDKATLSIGPYAEVGLNKRTVSPQAWQSRSYQVGVRIGINYPSR